jgi:MFS family permease
VRLNKLAELRNSWRFLTAAFVGLAFGYTLNLYLANTFAPYLLREFGWQKSQFALLGETVLAATVTLPVVGRLTDTFGARRIVAVGVSLTPFLFIALSRMTGSFSQFFLLNVLQTIVGTMTTSLVYSRLIAQNFHRMRGLALAVAACAAPAVGALVTRPLVVFIDMHGWRAGYLLVGAATAVGGATAFALIPSRQETAVDTAGPAAGGRSWRDYREILRSNAFRTIAVGMLLCNFTLMVQSSQLKLVLLDHGLPSDIASSMLSIYALGIVCGRIVCGLALDRFATHVVAALSLGLPCIGLFILGSGSHGLPLVTLAVTTVGLSMGAELDVVAYLAARYFRREIYSTVYGLIVPMVSLSGAGGSLLLSLTLKGTGTFSLFLYLAAAATLVGSGFFLLLGSPRIARYEPCPAQPC